MPKKSHGRPAKGKPRTRRTAPRPTQTLTAEPVDTPTTTAVAAAPAAVPVASAGPTAAARRGASARRAPTLSVNYHYLRHDVLTLSVLAPLMVVLLIVAYFVLH